MSSGSDPVSVVRLRAADAEAYRALRLEGLAQAPHAFGSTYAEEAARPVAWFAERLEANTVLGAFEGSALVGSAGLAVADGRPKQRHKGVLFGMYVRASARHRGIGAMLVRAVLDHAAGLVEQVQLTVEAGNMPARRLYAKLGFVEWGVEPRALKQDGRYFDEAWMVKILTP